MPTEILIDPNVRVAGNLTFSGFEDVRSLVGGAIPREGERVIVREPEANLVTVGTVVRVEPHDELIYIAVDWGTLAPEAVPTPAELQALLGQPNSEASVSSTFSERLLSPA